MQEGQRYLFLCYGPLSISGVFRRIIEHGPGAISVEVVDWVPIGEVGPIGTALDSQVYEDGQSGEMRPEPRHIAWHDIAQWSPQR